MDKQVIITVGREFGSGGTFIANAIAEEFHIPVYDRNILAEISKEKGTSLEGLEHYSEKPRSKFFTRTVRGETSSIEKHIANMQFDFLRSRAAEGNSFVVLGRCSEEILKDFNCLINIFILADPEFKKLRVMEKYELSEEDALAKMKRKDKYRKQYHNSYASSKWGDSRTYDLCINSTRLGVEETAKEVIRYIYTRINAMK